MKDRLRFLTVVGALLISAACDGPVSPERGGEVPKGPDGLDPRTGEIRVTTATTGPFPDPHGYGVAIDGGPAESIGLNATETFTGLTPGDHKVELTVLAPNCGVTGSDSQTLAVLASDTTSTDFEVECLSTPGGSAATTGIAFVSHREGGAGNPEIYVMDTDGSNPVRLTNDAVWSAEPAWSPDGRHIAYNNGGDIVVAYADGSDPVSLTGGGLDSFEDFEPTWSPYGTHIAFVRDVTNWFGLEIYVMEADRSNPVRLTYEDGGTRPFQRRHSGLQTWSGARTVRHS